MKSFKKFLEYSGNLNESKESSDKKIHNDAFVYLDPKPPENKFAQCSTCALFLPGKQRCGIFSKDFKVVANAACSLYVHGKPHDDQQIINSVSPEEAGYVVGQVRCENCGWYEADHKECGLYEMLNKKLPDVFDLDEYVDPKGCCNAWGKRE
jgi:hypothetical protein